LAALTKWAKALNRTLSSLPNGIGKQQSTFQTWVAQVKEVIDCAYSIWRRGVPQDYMQAYFWFSLNGHEGNTADAKSHLSLQQTRETDRLVKEWKE
jgi:hypothetical protein